MLKSWSLPRRDEALDRRVLATHTETAARRSRMPNGTGDGVVWKKNGVLLSLAELEFDVLVTVDHGIEYEQNLANRKMAVLVLAARSNQIEDLEPIIPAALAALRSIHPGRAIRVGAK